MKFRKIRVHPCPKKPEEFHHRRLRNLAKVHPAAPADVLALGRRGAFEVSFFLGEHLSLVESYLRKYRNIPPSLADACLIRCAEVYDEPRITPDSHFRL